MASVIELDGRLRDDKTFKLVTLAVEMVDEATVLVAMVVVAEKVLRPEKVWLAASLAKLEASERLPEARPEIVALVRLRVEETVRAPMVEVLVMTPPQPLRRPVRVPPVRAR